MKTVGRFLLYFFSIIFALFSFSYIRDSIFSGVLALGLALLAFPPILAFIEKKKGEKINGLYLFASLGFSFVISVFSWIGGERNKDNELKYVESMDSVDAFIYRLTDKEFEKISSDKGKIQFLEDEKLNAQFTDLIVANLHKRDSILIARNIVKDKKLRQKNIESQFSGWNGSHIKLEAYIKKTMNDPNSYEHVETKFWDMKDHLVVSTTFRGKNAFGGVVTNSIKAKVKISSGNVIQIMQ